ncbi:uncharacterized protein LOC129949139 [Eupeodes corollae]|uniref:uncharacterized protein LOC129949139 n=1 Tax=Eupeodes corollae TaxID=290404 RepID=UPI0024903C3E|nr:uncharacterized protein LOC129949139 [Eupeodes corollae]
MSDNFASKYLELPPFDYTLYEENCGLEWRNWLRSFEWYLKATHIEDDSEKFVKLLHLAGRKVQELYEALPTPASLAEVARGPLAIGCSPHPTDYGIALCKLNEFFEPKRNATYERHVFRLIKQEKSEQFGIFVMRLRIQSEKCDFGEAAEDNVKDQIIEKCFSAKLRRELLKLGDCKLDNILRSAKVFEAIEEQCKTFDSSVNTNNQLSENVNTIDSKAIFKTNRANDNKIECTRCGYAGHRAFDEKCPARGKLCNKCGGKDHFIRKCRSKKRIHSYNTATTKEPDFKQRMKHESEDRQTKKIKATESETIKLLDSTTKLDEYIFCIGDSKANEISCKIGGVTITVVVDSGSKYNIIDGSNWDFLKANKVKVSKQRKDADGLEFKAYGGHPLTTIGIFEATVQTTSKCCVADFYVVKDYGKALIGYETGIPLGVMKIGENINQVEQQSSMSKIKGFVVDIPLKENVKPVAQPYRRVPVPLEEAVDKKIDELLEQGIIEKVNEPSQWISPVVPVPKGDDVRVCIDMRRANEAVQRENHPLPTMEDFLPHIGKGQFFTKLDVKNAFHQV